MRIVIIMVAFIWFPYVTLMFFLIQEVVGWTGFSTSSERSKPKELPPDERSLYHANWALASTKNAEVSYERPAVWYSHPDIGRDRTHLTQTKRNFSSPNSDNSSRFLVVGKLGMQYEGLDGSDSVKPTYHSTADISRFLVQYTDISSVEKLEERSDDSSLDPTCPLLAWVGSFEGQDYWVVYLPTLAIQNDDDIFWAPLREFGDRLSSAVDAGIASTANGLIEFHKTHRFCSQCGSPTISAKAGSCRQCTRQNDPNCPARSVYPRIDVATIMLITSPCGQYALLGRKKSWPQGRFSTLAGFVEVGETLEDCCIRETYEESGVSVSPSSVKFVASQPWPFPRSLMVGFQGTAFKSPGHGDDNKSLPPIVVDPDEMEDVRWFEKEFVRERLSLAGSSGLTYQPTPQELEFHIPGRSSLARVLITEWAMS